MDTFWGYSSTFWTAIAALATTVYTVFVIVTLWVIYLQVRMAAKSFQFEAICRLQGLVDDFREDRLMLFKSCPKEIVLSHSQFPRKPPTRRGISDIKESELKRTALNMDQIRVLSSISEELKESAKRVIARLNDIGQLVEDGFVDKEV